MLIYFEPRQIHIGSVLIERDWIFTILGGSRFWLCIEQTQLLMITLDAATLGMQIGVRYAGIRRIEEV